MNNRERDEARARFERDRAKLIERLRRAAEAEDVYEHANVSHFGVLGPESSGRRIH
jgi:hypothetical protein